MIILKTGQKNIAIKLHVSALPKKIVCVGSQRLTFAFGIPPVMLDELHARIFYSIRGLTIGPNQSIPISSKILHIPYCKHKTSVHCE